MTSSQLLIRQTNYNDVIGFSTPNIYHKKEIIFSPRVPYDITGVKKIKLNSQLSYISIQDSNNQDINFQINQKQEYSQSQSLYSQNEYNEECLIMNQQYNNKQARKYKSVCGYKKCEKSQPIIIYENFKSLFSLNNYDVKKLLSLEKMEFTQLFMQFYDPRQLFKLESSSLKKLFLQDSNTLNQSIKFNFKESIQINYKEMKEEDLLKVKKALKNLFYLYLNGDYRGINDNFSIKDVETEDWEKTISNRYVSYKYKSKHINFDYSQSKKAEDKSTNNSPIRKNNGEAQEIDENQNTLENENAQNKNENNKKQVIYNKSKYVMQFLLKLLDKDHLDFLTIPEGFTNKILGIQKNIKETSKRNKMSQSQFYNHNHFDCLFLQMTSVNDQYIQNSQELQQLHCNVFEFADLVDSFTINTINLYKELISQIILLQINLIRDQIIPQLSVHTLSFKSSSKLKYFERICDSIEKLKEGHIISKF